MCQDELRQVTMTSTKRAFRDAPAWGRCGVAVRLRDGSFAQCGRWQNDGYRRNPLAVAAFCTQHGDMFFAGKCVHLFLNGYPVAKLSPTGRP